MLRLKSIARRVAYPLVACVVIVLAIIATLYLPDWLRPARKAPEPKLQANQIPLSLRIQGKLMVTMAEANPNTKQALWEQISTLNTGPVLQRQWFVVMAGELAPEKTFVYCKGLSIQISQNLFFITEEEKEAQFMLDRIYVNKEDPDTFSDKEKKMLAPLGWFGRLALAPQGHSERASVLAEAKTFGIAVGIVPILFIVLGIGGIIGLILALLYTRKRLFPPKIEPGLYAETFACWMVLFLILQIVGGFIGSWLFPRSTLLVVGIFTLLSMLALLWPKWRIGASLEDIRRDIGLTFGPKPFREILVGLGGYAMGIPFLAAGIIVMFILARLAGVDLQAPISAAHPIAVLAMQADWWVKIQILFVASIVAPLVEETFFRGALYRYARFAMEAKGLSVRSAIFWSTNVSILASGTICAFVFAIAHPQGIIAVPVLMAMAWNFTLLREWRGSLVPAMITHGISNGVTLGLLIFMAAQ